MSRLAMIWCLILAVWTVALLVPLRIPLSDELPWLVFFAAKGLHISAYFVLSLLGGRLGLSFGARLLLLFFLMAHGSVTEFLQGFVKTRSGSARDVCIDNLGVLLGLILSWKGWSGEQRSSAPAGVTPESAAPAPADR